VECLALSIDKSAQSYKIVERQINLPLFITCGGVKVSTGVWNKDKRAVAVIHVKSTRSKETLKQTTISHWLHSSAPRVGPVSPAAREPGVMHAGTSCVISR